jgi:glycosyltransferase involved in cell wall biosynthesis
MQNKLVSIISPCYNGESYLGRFLDSVLEQEYKNLEVILINDGSTDDTEKVVLSYKEKFEAAGIEFIYIYQNNAGQAAAVNKGLAIFKGKYLMWVDSDDILDPKNISKKLEFLETNTEYGYVMCRAREVMEDNVTLKVKDLKRVEPSGEDNMFLDLIMEKNVVYTPGVYLVRREAFLDAIPTRQIYESSVGQNWQLLLPIAYKYKCGYIKDELFSYVIRDDSHSRKEKTLSQELEKLKSHNELLLYLLNDMGLGDSMYVHMLDDKYIRKQFDAAYRHHDKKVLNEKYNLMKSKGYATKRDTLIYLAGMYPLVDAGYAVFKNVKSTVRAMR